MNTEISLSPETQGVARPGRSTNMAEILIVDDEEPIRRLLQRILGVEYGCTLTSNAPEARTCLSERDVERG